MQGLVTKLFFHPHCNLRIVAKWETVAKQGISLFEKDLTKSDQEWRRDSLDKCCHLWYLHRVSQFSSSYLIHTWILWRRITCLSVSRAILSAVFIDIHVLWIKPMHTVISTQSEKQKKSVLILNGEPCYFIVLSN